MTDTRNKIEPITIADQLDRPEGVIGTLYGVRRQILTKGKNQGKIRYSFQIAVYTQKGQPNMLIWTSTIINPSRKTARLMLFFDSLIETEYDSEGHRKTVIKSYPNARPNKRIVVVRLKTNHVGDHTYYNLQDLIDITKNYVKPQEKAQQTVQAYA